MPTLGSSGIFFDEDENSPTFEVDIAAGKIIFTQTGLGNWSDINAMYNYLMAPTLVFGEFFGVFAGAGFPDNDNIRCVKAKATPADTISGADAAGVNLHNTARWFLQYENIKAPFGASSDPVPMLTHEWDVGGEFLVFKGATLQWSDGAAGGSDARGGILIPTVEWSVTWPRLTTPPFSAIRSCIGKVNSNSMTFDTGTVDPETLLFLGAKVRRDFLSDGSLAWQFTYKFSERRVPAADQAAIGGWNHFFRNNPAKNGFYRLRLTTAVNGSKDIYQLIDFSPLFQVGP